MRKSACRVKILIPGLGFYRVQSHGTAHGLSGSPLSGAGRGSRIQMEAAHEFKLAHIIFSVRDIYVATLNRSIPTFGAQGGVRTHREADCRDVCACEHPGHDRLYRERRPGIRLDLYPTPGSAGHPFRGANSHMAIRCAEFGLPAAIGCGDSLYARLTQAGATELRREDSGPACKMNAASALPCASCTPKTIVNRATHWPRTGTGSWRWLCLAGLAACTQSGTGRFPALLRALAAGWLDSVRRRRHRRRAPARCHRTGPPGLGRVTRHARARHLPRPAVDGVSRRRRQHPVPGHIATRHGIQGRYSGEVNSFHSKAPATCPAGYQVLPPPMTALWKDSPTSACDGRAGCGIQNANLRLIQEILPVSGGCLHEGYHSRGWPRQPHGRLDGYATQRLVSLRGKPLLEWQLASLRAAGIHEIALVTGYRHSLVPLRPAHVSLIPTGGEPIW